MPADDSGIHNGHAAVSKWVGRSDNAAQLVHNANQGKHGHSADLKDWDVAVIGHDNQHMAGVAGIVFDAAQYDKAAKFRMPAALRLKLIVAFIRIVIGNQHTVETILYEYGCELRNGCPRIQ